VKTQSGNTGKKQSHPALREEIFLIPEESDGSVRLSVRGETACPYFSVAGS
jgi:hypothetical protein